MQFLFSATDKTDSLHIRTQNRPYHVDFLKKSDDFGVKILIAGPAISTGQNMCGSVLILESDSIETVQKWLDNDPYAKAGLFEKTTLQEMKVVIQG